MPDRQTCILPIKCPNCGQAGSVAWNVPTPANTSDRSLNNLIKVSAGFHWEVGRSSPGLLSILCDQCDEIQP